MHLRYVEGSYPGAGFNALDEQGLRYKFLVSRANIIEVSTLECDFIVMASLTADGAVDGLWQVSIEQARGIFLKRRGDGTFYRTQQEFEGTAKPLP